MARATWSGFLSFGLVSVPVGLYQRDVGPDDPLQPIAQEHVAPGALQEGRRRDGRGAHDRGHRQRLSARWRRVRRRDPRRDGRSRTREVRTDRDPGLRRSRGDRPDLLSPVVLSRAQGEGRRPRVRAVAPGDASRRRRWASRRWCCATRNTSSPFVPPRRC